MAKKPNHGFERSGRARQKAASLIAKQGIAEDPERMATFRAWAGGATP
jgi:hypothetical protein